MTVATMEGGTLPMPPDLEVAITSQNGAAEPEFVHNVGGHCIAGTLVSPKCRMDRECDIETENLHLASIGSGSRRCRFSASDVGGIV
jgi:hypothetical protein